MAFMCMGILLVIKGNILSTLDEFFCKGLVLQYMLFKGQESSFLQQLTLSLGGLLCYLVVRA